MTPRAMALHAEPPAQHEQPRAQRPPSTAPRRPRRCLVVWAGSTRTGEAAAQALADSLAGLGIDTKYLGRQESARLIARAVADERVDSLELCLGVGGVRLLRELLHELAGIGRREVSIVVHKVT